MKRSAENEAAEPVPAVSWKRFDFARLHPTEFSPSKSQYGGFSGKCSYGAAFSNVLITGPAMRVLHEPSVWDEQKQAKWGKSGKPLDADRKTDKWNIELELDNAEFEAFLERYVQRRAADVHAAQERFLPAGAKPMSLEVIASKFYSLIKHDKNTGAKTLGFDGRCEKGSTAVPLVLEDEEGNAITTGVGKNAWLYPVMDLSAARVADKLMNVKQYVDPIKFIVKRDAYVPPSVPVNAKCVKADIDD